MRTSDPLLLSILEGFPHELPHLPPIAKDECWIINSRGIARCYLTYLVRLLFGLHRMPGFGERCFNPPLDRKDNRIFQKLAPRRRSKEFERTRSTVQIYSGMFEVGQDSIQKIYGAKNGQIVERNIGRLCALRRNLDGTGQKTGQTPFFHPDRHYFKLRFL